MDKTPLEVVEEPRQVAASHANFARGLTRAKRRAISLLRRTWYWIYDPATRTFSPSKFSGYVAMDFSRYEAAARGHREGAKFDGFITQQAIARVLGDYLPDAELTQELLAWAQSMFGTDVLEGIDVSKWRFVRLPSSGGGLAALAGGWEGSDELVDDLANARRSPGRSVPDLD